MTTTQYNLIELHSLFNLNQIAALSNEDIEITLDNKHDVSCIQLLTHDEREYFSFINEATNFNDSYWLSDNHIVTISTTEDATTDETTNETTIDAIADLCADLSSNQILKLIGKLSKIAVKNENKKTKKSKPEKTQTEKKDRVSAKNFNYYNLLKSWHGIPTDKIIADGLNGGYSSSVINEDKRVINVLMGTDKDIVISQEWIDYIVNFWHENPDTTWTRLHYAFSKGGRKCSDRGLLCNYIIDNGVSKEDIEAAIASQN